jgi:tetratricopeptide (TPR) repeat protein
VPHMTVVEPGVNKMRCQLISNVRKVFHHGFGKTVGRRAKSADSPKDSYERVQVCRGLECTARPIPTCPEQFRTEKPVTVVGLNVALRTQDARKLFREGRFEEAVPILDAVLRYAHNSRDALVMRAAIFEKEGEYEKAAALYKSACELRRDNETPVRLAYCLHRAGDTGRSRRRGE